MSIALPSQGVPLPQRDSPFQKKDAVGFSEFGQLSFICQKSPLSCENEKKYPYLSSTHTLICIVPQQIVYHFVFVFNTEKLKEQEL
jgi:hypothetical protein